jgi:chaperonin GroES
VSDWSTNAKEAVPHVSDGRPADTAPPSLAGGLGRLIRRTFRSPPVRVPRKGDKNVMDIRPLHDRIIVRRLDEGEQKSGAIIIPDTAKEKPQRGEVIATGTGKVKDDGKRVPLDVKAGDHILFGKYTSQEVTLDGEEYLIMREDEVLAVIAGGTTHKK